MYVVCVCVFFVFQVVLILEKMKLHLVFSYKEITVKIELMINVIVSITVVMSTMLHKVEFVFKFFSPDVTFKNEFGEFLILPNYGF